VGGGTLASILLINFRPSVLNFSDWRHYEIFAQAPGKPIPAEVRRATELVIRPATEVGNYDYLIDYVFQQDDVIRVVVGSTGLDAVKGVAASSMIEATAPTEMQYGTFIAPNLLGPNHDHFFNFRLDFDIDGRQSTFVRTDLVPAAVAEGSPRRSMWKTKDAVPMSELEGRYKVNLAHAGNVSPDEHGSRKRPRPSSRLHDPAREQRRL